MYSIYFIVMCFLMFVDMVARFFVIDLVAMIGFFFFFSSRRRHTRYWRDWSSDVCSSDLEDYARDLHLGLKGLRVGYVRHFHERDVEATPEVAAALDEAARVLAAEGAELRDVELPPLGEFGTVNRVILCAEAAAVHEPWLRERPGDYARLTLRRLLPGMFLSAVDHVQAQRRRTELTAAVEEAFREVDLLLCASSMDPACRIDDPGEVDRTYGRQARTPFNVTGHPAVSVMCGVSKIGRAHV